jgi:hypothetical protein
MMKKHNIVAFSIRGWPFANGALGLQKNLGTEDVGGWQQKRNSETMKTIGWIARTRRRKSALLAGAAFCLTGLWLSGMEPTVPGPDAPARPDRETPIELRREGDEYSGLGRFETTGDRITYYAEDNKESFRVLENLALERIARVLEDPSGLGHARKWSVTGLITEFRGSNYLLIERAILKGR